MNLKKLSLAAAISIGVLTAGNAVKAEVNEIDTSSALTVAQAEQLAPAVEETQNLTTSSTDPTELTEVAACGPYQTGAAAPLEPSRVIIQGVPITKLPEAVPTGAAASACPITPQVSAPANFSQLQYPGTITQIQGGYPSSVILSECMTGAAAPAGGVCSTCQGSAANVDYIERQVYAYPSMSTLDTYVPAAGNIISFGEADKVSNINQEALASYQYGVPVTTTGINPASTAFYQYGTPFSITGAAAPLGYTGTTTTTAGCPALGTEVRSGVPVIDAPNFEATAPITMQTASSLKFTRTALVLTPMITGAAAPIADQFPDIYSSWARNQINKLAVSDVVVGYPDCYFMPNSPISRAEMSSMIAAGLNLNHTPLTPNQVFKDVPTNHWANVDINKVYKEMIPGYSDDTFNPSGHISRAEALAILSKSIPGELNEAQANQILSQYSDVQNIPAWAKIPIAKSINAGLLQKSPSQNQINPNQSATRSEISNMLLQLRYALALEQPDTPAVTGAAASLQEETITAPVLNVKFNDNVTSRASNVGDSFTANTTEDVTINGVLFPAGSTVNGKVVEIQRPGAGKDGAIKLAFENIKHGSDKSALPKQVLTAQVQAVDTPAWKDMLIRAVEFPFIFPGRVIGTVGRTVGGMTVLTGNSSESILDGLGVASGELINGEFGAAGRSTLGSIVETVKMPFDLTRTALNGAAGLANVTADEIGYLISWDGTRISTINPNDRVAIAFSCQ